MTKSRFTLMVRIFEIANYVLDLHVRGQNDELLDQWLSGALNGVELTQSDGNEVPLQILSETAVLVILTPQVFKLTLLVEDQALESRLRNEALKFLRTHKLHLERMQGEGGLAECSSSLIRKIITEKLQPTTPLLDLSQLGDKNLTLLQPKTVLNLSLGYLKLIEIEPDLAQLAVSSLWDVTMGEQGKDSESTLRKRIESMLGSDSPFENESGKLLVRFVSKIQISPYVLLDWITRNTSIYLKCSDILLKYISENWGAKPEVLEGEADTKDEREADQGQDDGDSLMQNLESVTPQQVAPTTHPILSQSVVSETVLQ